MSKPNWKIVIEGSGPCLGDTEFDADYGAKNFIMALKERGHSIHRAEFSGNGKLPADINVESRFAIRQPAGPPPADERDGAGSDAAIFETAAEARDADDSEAIPDSVSTKGPGDDDRRDGPA